MLPSFDHFLALFSIAKNGFIKAIKNCSPPPASLHSFVVIESFDVHEPFCYSKLKFAVNDLSKKMHVIDFLENFEFVENQNFLQRHF